MHRATHPEPVEGCFGCKVLTIAVSAEALPNRGASVIAINRKQERWDRDGAAYKRLRADGLQPPQIDGCRYAETTATERRHVEGGAA